MVSELQLTRVAALFWVVLTSWSGSRRWFLSFGAIPLLKCYLGLQSEFRSSKFV
jgi:hypothetical protein